MSAVYDWEAERFVAAEPDVPVEEPKPEPVAFTWENDPRWVPWCREHPSWGYGSQVPVIPPASACPMCSERQAPPEAPSTQTRYETDPVGVLNAQAPARAQEEWRRRDQRRRAWERAMLERNAEIRELEALLDGDAPSGGGYVPPGTMPNKTYTSTYTAKRRGKKLQAAKARLDHLLSQPLDLPVEVEYHGREMWDVSA